MKHELTAKPQIIALMWSVIIIFNFIRLWITGTFRHRGRSKFLYNSNKFFISYNFQSSNKLLFHGWISAWRLYIHWRRFKIFIPFHATSHECAAANNANIIKGWNQLQTSMRYINPRNFHKIQPTSILST